MWGICCECTIASRSPVPLDLCSCLTSLGKMGKQAAPRGRGALEEMGTYQRHVLYFSRKFYLRQFDLFPKNFDPSSFNPIQKHSKLTRGLTLIFHPVPSTFFRPPSSKKRLGEKSSKHRKAKFGGVSPKIINFGYQVFR